MVSNQLANLRITFYPRTHVLTYIDSKRIVSSFEERIKRLYIYGKSYITLHVIIYCDSYIEFRLCDMWQVTTDFNAAGNEWIEER